MYLLLKKSTGFQKLNTSIPTLPDLMVYLYARVKLSFFCKQGDEEEPR